MNERIKELSKEAKKYAQQYVNESVIEYGKTASEFKRIFESKFAELIVRECAKFLEDNSGYDDSNNAWHPEPEDLLEYFGV